MSQNQLIVFVHVPKTAGITMSQVLARQYGRKGCFGTTWGPYRPEGASRLLPIHVGIKLVPNGTWYPEPLQKAAFRFLTLPATRQAEINAIKGHMSFGLDRYLPSSVAYITLLRNPVDQVLSSYYYTADIENRPKGMGLYEHLSTLLEKNFQTLILAGPYDDDASELPPPSERLERAKRNLRACAVVGLTERFDETMVLMRKAFGWRWPFYVRTNVNRERPPRSAIPKDTLRRIAADNELDVALYAYAQELFEQQVRQYGASFDRDLQTFRALNNLRQRWLRAVRFPRRTLRAIDRKIWPLFEPVYQSLADRGGLRRFLPSRLVPRIEAPQTLGRPNPRLWMGNQLIGSYHGMRKEWIIRRPFHLFVDESTLPR